MTKKTKIIILSIGLLIILGAILVWFLFLRNNQTPTLIPTNGGSPFGQGGEGTGFAGGEQSGFGPGLNEEGRPIAKLFRVTNTPVSGLVSFLKNGFTTVRYVDRATGHSYDVNPVTLEKIKITNTTLPKIYEAHFKGDGQQIVYRSLLGNNDVIENNLLLLTPPATTTDNLYTVVTKALRGDIREVSVHTSGRIAYNTRDTGEIFVTDTKGENPLSIFSSSFSDWRLAWAGNNLLLTTKGSANVPGYSYVLNTQNKSLTKVLGPLNALSTSISQDGQYMAYSFNSEGESLFRTIDLTNKNTSDIFPVTLGEKCVWGTKNSGSFYCGVPSGGVGPLEPDAWYQGQTHFTDRIWEFDITTGFTDVIADPKKDFNAEVDVLNPILSPDEDYLFFINKTDLTLWALKLI